MAILPDHPGLEVQVVVDGTPLQEYDGEDEENTPDKVTKFIEVKTGAQFAIRYVFTRPFPWYDGLIQIDLDGQRACGEYADKKNFRGKEYAKILHGREYMSGEGGCLQRFYFSELDIDDSQLCGAGEALKSKLDHLGEITVKAFLVKDITLSEEKLSIRESTQLGAISEKALKGRALSHHARFGQAEAAEKKPVANCTFVDPQKRPYATFIFKYRSRDALRALCVIPRTPSPVPLEERDVDSLTAEEMRELLRTQRERDGPVRGIKQEGVKREHSPDRSLTAFEDDDEVSFIEAKRRRTSKIPVILNEDGTEVFDLT